MGRRVRQGEVIVVVVKVQGPTETGEAQRIHSNGV